MEVSSEAIGNPSKPGFFQSFIERRLHRTILVYLGATWTVFGIVQWIVNRYVLSPHLEELFLMLALLFLPAILIIGYGHGAKGKQKWTGYEKIGLSCNAIIAVAVLVFMFGGKDLGSAREVVQVVDTEGNAVERIVPKDIFRKRLALFFFENESGDEELNWLQEAIPTAWDMDLEQDMFLVAKPAHEFIDKFQKAGFQDGLGIPTALQRSIASDYDLSYFVSGTINKEGDNLVIRTSLNDIDKGQEIASNEYTDPSILGIIDQMTVDLKSDLDLPKKHIEETKDVPIVDLLTDSEEALKAYRDGMHTLSVKRDFAGAAGYFEKATQVDPTFALGHLSHYIVMIQQGQMQPAMQSLAKTKQHDYRLTEQFKYLIKVAQLNLSGNQEQALEASKQWATLYPDDVQAHQIQGLIHSLRGEYEEAIASYRNLLAVDPYQDQVSLQLGSLLNETGKVDEAIEHFTAFNEQFPEKIDGLRTLARIYYEQGDLEKELETKLQALSISPDDPAAVRSVAVTQQRLGEFDKSFQRLETALSLSTTPAEKIASHFAVGDYYWYRGQSQDAISSFETAFELILNNSSAIDYLVRRTMRVTEYYHAGYPEKAQTIANEAINSPAAKQFPDLAALASDAASYLSAKNGNPEEGLQMLADAEALVESSGFGALRSVILSSRARVYIESEQYEEAKEAIDAYLELEPHSVSGHNRLGKILYETGEYKKAKESYLKANMHSPAGPTALIGLAKSEIALDNPEEATGYLERALKTLENADESHELAQEANALISGI